MDNQGILQWISPGSAFCAQCFLLVPNYSFLYFLPCKEKEFMLLCLCSTENIKLNCCENSSALCPKSHWHNFCPLGSLIQILGWALPHLYWRCSKERQESSEISPAMILQSAQGWPTHLWMLLYIGWWSWTWSNSVQNLCSEWETLPSEQCSVHASSGILTHPPCYLSSSYKGSTWSICSQNYPEGHISHWGF